MCKRGIGPWLSIHYAYPEVKMTDNERSATSLNTTDGFKHHKLKVYVQFPKALPGIEPINSNYNNAVITQAETEDSYKNLLAYTVPLINSTCNWLPNLLREKGHHFFPLLKKK